VLYWWWRLDAPRPSQVRIADPRKATVIVSAYSPRRARNLWPLARQVLKCGFVERLIISNNNPSQHLVPPADLTGNARLKMLNQNSRRGPGYSWVLAREDGAAYILGLDDDFLAYPSQLALLFQKLLADPTSPHGLAGKSERDSIRRYVVGRDADVEDLYVAYALTREHISRYAAFLEKASVSHGIDPGTVEFWADDIVISRTGPGKARIHDAGFLHLCPTATASSVASYREQGFRQKRDAVRRAIESIRKTETEAAERTEPAATP
jgi:hypothetical protein